MNKFIDLPNAQIAYRRVGQGADLIFVHGWPVDSRTFRYVVPTLAKHFTCHLFDLPGAGQTKWTEETDISLAGHSQTLFQLIDQLQLTRYALVAHDSGGVFARDLAAQRPDQVRGLVLINTDIPRKYAPTLKLLVSSAKFPGASKLMPRLIKRKSFRLSTFFGKGMFYDLEKFESEFGELFIKPLYLSKETFNGQMQLIYNWDWKLLDQLEQVHPQISAPVQLIWGRQDVIFPLEHGRGMIDQFGGTTELKVVDGSRLYVHEEQPDQVIEHALPFLKNCF